MNKSDEQIKKDVIKHWQDMIKWSEKQPKENKKCRLEMEENIKQNWYGQHCGFCQIYDRCQDCPISKKYSRCESENAQNSWRKVNNSGNWQEWTKNAKNFLKQLENI